MALATGLARVAQTGRGRLGTGLEAEAGLEHGQESHLLLTRCGLSGSDSCPRQVDLYIFRIREGALNLSSWVLGDHLEPVAGRLLDSRAASEEGDATVFDWRNG